MYVYSVIHVHACAWGKIYRLKTISSYQTNRELTHVKEIFCYSVFSTSIFKTRKEVKWPSIFISQVKLLHELGARPTLTSHYKSSRLLPKLHTHLYPPLMNNLLVHTVSLWSSSTWWYLSLNLFREPDTLYDIIAFEPLSLELLISFLPRGSKTFLAHPLSCVLYLARERHPGALRW